MHYSPKNYTWAKNVVQSWIAGLQHIPCLPLGVILYVLPISPIMFIVSNSLHSAGLHCRQS